MALKSFNPDAFLQDWSDEKYMPAIHDADANADAHNGKTFEQSIREAFGIPKSDSYVYRAQGATTLEMTQRAINGKRANGLHGWYHDEKGEPLTPQHPTTPEITAYTTLFHPSLSLPKTLKSLSSNAKKGTLQQPISNHLSTLYHNTPSTTASAAQTPPLLPSKKDRHHKNPYYTYFLYTCHELEWAGPVPSTTYTKTSHHILPVLYHHFGCIVPSYSALHALARLAQPPPRTKKQQKQSSSQPELDLVRPILDMGSGNGYWTFMLRNFPLAQDMKPLTIHAIDNQLSEYRVTWIKDTIHMDAKEYLKRNQGGKNAILLLVYPQATGDFTGPVMKIFEGDTIVVAGTQNGNGFTAFQDQRVDEWVEKNLPSFELTLRMPLPSFAGKDEALFVFQRRSQV